MEVIDGQHRIKAAEQLGLDIYYLIDDNYDPMKMILLNTARKAWKPEDYLNYWIFHGRSDYNKMKEFQTDLGFTLTVMLRWLYFSKTRSHKSFKEGNFRFVLSQQLLVSIMAMKKLITYMKSRNYKPRNIYNQSTFHIAARRFFMNEFVNHERFFSRIASVPFQIQYSMSWQEYLEQFVEIYNFSMKKDRLKFKQDGKLFEITK